MIQAGLQAGSQETQVGMHTNVPSVVATNAKDPLAVVETIVTIIENFGPTAWAWLQGLIEAVGAPGEELKKRLDTAVEEMRQSRTDVRDQLAQQEADARAKLGV